MNIPGEELLTTSTQFLELDRLPSDIVFVGGGYIAFEFAHIAARAGARVQIVHRGAHPLERFDPDLVGKLVEAKDIELGADDSKSLAVLIQNLNFFQLPAEDRVRGFDGDQWIVEGVSQGKYHVAVRWCADSYDPEKRKLTTFLALCRFLLDKSTLSERPKNKGSKLL